MVDQRLNLSPTRAQRLAARQAPEEKPLGYQKWRDLLFMHWSFDAKLLQDRLPKGLYIDTFEDQAYLGIVSFLKQDVKPSLFGEALPGIEFHELHLRTYVYNEKGMPGIWLFSSELSNWFMVHFLKLLYHLPAHYSYFHFKENETKDKIEFFCQRKGASASRFHYQPTAHLGMSLPDSLEFFLVERYLLYSADGKGNIYMKKIHHLPHTLSHAKLLLWDENVLEWNQFTPTHRAPDHVVLSRGGDVDIYPCV